MTSLLTEIDYHVHQNINFVHIYLFFVFSVRNQKCSYDTKDKETMKISTLTLKAERISPTPV